MISLREHIDIRAEVETVFTFVADPERIARMVPRLTHFKRLPGRPNDRFQGRYEVNVLGLSMSGDVRTTDYRDNERIVWVLTGAVRGTVRWYVERVPHPDRTRFTVAATYRPPGPAVIRRVARSMLQRGTLRQVRTLLRRTKQTIEG